MNSESAMPVATPSARKPVWINDAEKELDLLAFTGMLSILVNGGIGFGQTFNLLNSYHRGWLQPILRGLEATVINDREPLSKAMAKYPEVFSEAYVANVELGESADLGAVLESLYRQILRDLRSDNFMHCPCPAALGNSCRQISEILEIVGSESRALSLVAKTSPDEQVQAALLELEKQSLEGVKLADCQLPSLFPPIFAGLLAAHDTVGSVPSAFRNLADLLEARSGPLVMARLGQPRSSQTPLFVGLTEGQLLKDRYRIDGPLGRGGMGAVYLGFDTQTNSQVALKSFVSNSDGQATDFHRRFQDEVHILKSLNFPGIPQFADSFEIEGQCFLVMEYIQGLSLSELLEKTQADQSQQGLPAHLVVRVGIQICKILEHIHSLPKPLIHRDIKPHNIIIRDSDERIFLVDFGLAREVLGKNSLISMVGTAAYAPLEQFQGRPEARSDIYSLSVTMCELLSGKQPIPLHAEPIQTLVPDVHEDLARIINRASRTLVQERYAEAGDMLMLLEDVLPRLGETPQPVAPVSSEEDKMEQMIRRWGRGKSPSTNLLVPPVAAPAIQEPISLPHEILGELEPISAPRVFPTSWIGLLVLTALFIGGLWAWRASRSNTEPAILKKSPSSSATPERKSR